MPRGKYYPEELREEARRLRQEGWSLSEIAARLGPAKHTLSVWLRNVELSVEQRSRLHEKERMLIGRNRALAAQANRQARLARIDLQRQKAKALLTTATGPHRDNHIAAAMLYLAEGAKGEGACAFGNSNPQIIRYWLHLLRTSFDVDEAKFCLQIMCRADQDLDELVQYWMHVTHIQRVIKGHIDSRTKGKPTKRLNYKGVCSVLYHDVSLRRYLDALAQELMGDAGGEATSSSYQLRDKY